MCTLAFATLMVASGCRKQRPADPNKSELLLEVKSDLAGYKIAYATQRDIMMMDPNGTNSEVLAEAGPVAGYISWSADARYVYYASTKGPSETAWEAWRVNVITRQAEQLSNFGRDVRSLGTSPDNRYLAISLMTGNSSIGNNNNNLTQFNTDLYIVEMERVEELLAQGSRLSVDDLTPLVQSPPAEQFWYEELSWNPVLPADGMPELAYSKTWRYDEDAVSYTHAYTIKADGSKNTLIAENQDMPIWDFTGERISFLGLGVYQRATGTVQQLQLNKIKREASGGSISPNGKYLLFEVGDRGRQGGIARFNLNKAENGEVLKAKNVHEPRWSPVPIPQ